MVRLMIEEHDESYHKVCHIRSIPSPNIEHD
jgi:hypothetical protein